MQQGVASAWSVARATIGDPDASRWEVAYNPQPIGQKVT
jgi:hypothetical protein